MASQQWVWLGQPKIDRVRASVLAAIRVHRVDSPFHPAPVYSLLVHVLPPLTHWPSPACPWVQCLSRGTPTALEADPQVAALMPPAFDADVLAVALPALARFTLLADTLPYAFFDCFLPTRLHITHLALPHFVGMPPDTGKVPPAAVPALAALDTGPGLATALAPGRPLQRVMLRVASTLYDGLRPAALFGALGGQLKELVLVLAPNFDVRTVAGHTGKDWWRAEPFVPTRLNALLFNALFRILALLLNLRFLYSPAELGIPRFFTLTVS
ncbi:hypothetical protein BC826DRAFT_1107566 [Russula brevipes]|nr:hypothetical protein BC826DRAFT_1107566 [Russula brevipes]